MSCEHNRAKQIVPGINCYPVLTQSLNSIPVWIPGTWHNVGWKDRLDLSRSYSFLCVGVIPSSDPDCGHLDCALLLGDNKLLVTSMRWLVTQC